MKTNFTLIIFFFFLRLSFAQPDSMPYSRDYEFNEGLYLTINQFKSNDPLSKQAIISSIPKNELDFLKQVTEQKVINYIDANGKEQQIETISLWGYCQNRSVYLNFNNEFNKLNVIGALCHFTAIVKINIGYRDPMNYNYGFSNTADELRQFVLDTKSNKVFDFDVKNMELLLLGDSDLQNQFMALKKRNKANSIFIFLRKYNEKHPFYLPVN